MRHALNRGQDMEAMIQEAGIHMKQHGIDKVIFVKGKRGATYMFHRNFDGITFFVYGMGAKHGRCQPSEEVVSIAKAV